MSWSCAVALYTVNYNGVYIHWDSKPVMNYMIQSNAKQYIILAELWLCYQVIGLP
jgi:hypothetical protein